MFQKVGKKMVLDGKAVTVSELSDMLGINPHWIERLPSCRCELSSLVQKLKRMMPHDTL